MQSPLDGLEPRSLWERFDGLRLTPRPSEKEEKALVHIMEWAAERGFEARQDEAGNILVKVPASPGREGATPVIIQGHVDMVCLADDDVDIDFENDPIDVYVENGWVKARGTTLGADNGIGVAAGMAVAEDPDVSHGPLELLITVEEETGLTGASSLDFPELEGRRLLNLDSEEIGTLYVGCAGGGQDVISLPLERMEPHAAPGGNVAFEIAVSGLKGGHSGLEIGSHRGNSIKLLARLLWSLREEVAFALCGIEGGSAHNAIPKDARATIVLGGADAERTQARALELAETLKTEFATHEPGQTWAVTKVEEPESVLKTRTRDTLLRLLLALPHGIDEMSGDMLGLVETSSSVATLTTEGPVAEILVSSRSSIPEALEGLRMRVAATGELAGAQVLVSPGYPAWRPDMDSPLLAISKAAWKERTGEDPEVTVIHAGLECGIIGEKLPGVDMISFGPTIVGAHTPLEAIELATVDGFWNLLKDILAQD